MENDLYSFEKLKDFLNVNGMQVKEPYMPVNPMDEEWYTGGKHIEFEKDGIYLTKRNGGKQKVFLYRKTYFGEKPQFHIFCCDKVKKPLIGNVFRCANTGSVPVVNFDTKESSHMDALPICGYCAEKAWLNKSYNSASYINLLRKGQSIVDIHTNENLSVYADNWQTTKLNYLEKVNYTCERCKLHILDRYDQETYLHVLHKNHAYNDDSEKNLQCLCLDCLSKVDHRSVWVNGANKLTLSAFRQKYRHR